MTEKQLQQLIGDGDIYSVSINADHFENITDYSNGEIIRSNCHYIAWQGEYYSLGEELQKLIDNSFSFEASHHSMIELLRFAEIVEDKIKFSSPRAEKKIELIESILNQKLKLKNEAQIHPSYTGIDSETGQPLKVHITEKLILDDAKGKWINLVGCNLWDILKIIKFDIFEGAKIQADLAAEYLFKFYQCEIEGYKMPGEPGFYLSHKLPAEILVKNLVHIRPAFNCIHEQFDVIFENLALLRQIEYLREKLTDVETTHLQQPKNHPQIASLIPAADKDFVSIKDRKKNTQIYQELKDIFRTELLFKLAIKALEVVLEDHTVTGLPKNLRHTGIIKSWYQSLLLNKWLKYQYIPTPAVAECINNYFKNKHSKDNIVSEKTLRPKTLNPLEVNYKGYFLAKLRPPTSAQ